MDPECNGIEQSGGAGQVKTILVLRMLIDDRQRREEELEQEQRLREEERRVHEEEFTDKCRRREAEHDQHVRYMQEYMNLLKDIVLISPKGEKYRPVEQSH